MQSWLLFGGSWSLWRLFVALGTRLAAPRPLSDHSWPVLGALGPLLVVLGAFLDRSWAHSWIALGRSWVSSVDPKSLQNRSTFRSFFGFDFRSIWGRFGAPTWSHVRPFGRPSSAKLSPKCVPKVYQHQKRVSHQTV